MPLPFTRGALEQKLQDSGRPATAEILVSEPTHHVYENGSPLRLITRRWTLTLRVQPDGEPEFEGQLTEPLDPWILPRVDDAVELLYDADDHSKMMLTHANDPSPRPEWEWNWETGTSPPKAARARNDLPNVPSEHRDELERMVEFYAKGALYDFEFDELRRRILGLPLVDPRPGMVRALGLTPEAAAQTFIRGADGKDIPLAGPPPSPETASREDRIDELEKLADLHDKGTLTDAEFEAEKQTLLGST